MNVSAQKPDESRVFVLHEGILLSGNKMNGNSASDEVLKRGYVSFGAFVLTGEEYEDILKANREGEKTI